MSADQVSQQIEAPASCIRMESIDRISKLPVVESTINTATSIYDKVRDYNSVTTWTLQTAEDTVNKAVEVGKPIVAPVVTRLEKPIKTVDGILCSGLDYVESKVPAVKLPPTEMYTSTKEYVSTTVTPAVETACAYVKPAMNTARNIVEPAVQSALHTVEPVVESVKHAVEPYVQPAMDTASAIKEYGTHKVEEFLHIKRHDAETSNGNVECNDCKENVEQPTKGDSH